MAHTFDALAGEHVVGKLIVYDDGPTDIPAELYTDGGDHWNH